MIKIILALGLGVVFLTLAIISIVGVKSLFEPKAENKIVQIDITDREKGICAGMYKEGFKWGYGQFSLAVGEGRITGKSDIEIKEILFRMSQNKLENL